MPGIRQDEVERIALAKIQHELMQTVAVAKFRKAFKRQRTSILRERRADQDVYRVERQLLDREIQNYASAIARGLQSEEIFRKLEDAERRRRDLLKRMQDLEVEPPSLPEDLSEQYRAAIQDLADTLSSTGIVQRASESLTKKIDRIVIRKPDNGPHEIELVGDIVEMRAPTRSGPTPTGRLSVR
jgi:hypothetical protein